MRGRRWESKDERAEVGSKDERRRWGSKDERAEVGEGE